MNPFEKIIVSHCDTVKAEMIRKGNIPMIVISRGVVPGTEFVIDAINSPDLSREYIIEVLTKTLNGYKSKDVTIK